MELNTELLSSVEEYYGIWSNDLQRLLTYNEELNRSGYACNETKVYLSEDEHLPEFLLKSLDDIRYAFYVDTPWYNSKVEWPSHGSVNLSRCEIVKVKRSTQVSKLPNLNPVFYFDKDLEQVYSVKPALKTVLKLPTKKTSGGYFLLVVKEATFKASQIKEGATIVRSFQLERVAKVLDHEKIKEFSLEKYCPDPDCFILISTSLA